MENNKMKIAHIMHFGKFVDDAINLFDSIDYLDNIYYFKEIKDELNNVRNKKRLIIKRSIKDIIDDIIEKETSIVVLHSKRFGLYTRQFLRLKKNIKLIWISFGFDIYSDTSIIRLDKFPIKINLFSPKTKKYLITHPNYLLGMVYRFFENYIVYPKFLQRVNYVSTVFDEEYDLLIKDKNVHAKEFFFKFVDKDKYDKLPDLVNFTDRYGIIVGNSSTYSGNHLDIFNKLKGMSLTKKDKIIVPLNYGYLKYRDYLLHIGEKMFGNCFMPLIDYVPLKEYLFILSNCKAAIMGHKRQQGIGNISRLIMYGAKVYLPKDSVTYYHYKKMGVDVFSIEDDLSYEHLNKSLSQEQIEKNFNILKQTANYDLVRNNLIHSIEKVIQDIDSNI
jgi:hypothetical protein